MGWVQTEFAAAVAANSVKPSVKKVTETDLPEKSLKETMSLSGDSPWMCFVHYSFFVADAYC